MSVQLAIRVVFNYSGEDNFRYYGAARKKQNGRTRFRVSKTVRVCSSKYAWQVAGCDPYANSDLTCKTCRTCKPDD
jgi:hypothetical protein